MSVKKIASHFCDIFNEFDKYKKYFIANILFDIKKFILPILRCNLLTQETITLENKYLKYVDPNNFYHYLLIQDDFEKMNKKLQCIAEKIIGIIKNENVEFICTHRIKSSMSIMNAIIKEKFFLYDKYGVRLIIDVDKNNFYQFVWGLVLNLFKDFYVIETRDYLAYCRQTGYSAVHCIMIYDGLLFELQIKSKYDMQIKIPHFKYKQFLSEYNTYIETNVKTVSNKIEEDFKLNSKCHF